MTDEDLLALNIYEEANLEVPDGKAAIARVVKNRMAHKFESDGTVAGTILKKDQFSWAWFDFKGGKYARVAWTPEGAQHIADEKFAVASQKSLATCREIGYAVMTNMYHGPFYDMLTDNVVSYLNPKIVPHLPDWATEDKLVCIIGHHSFFRT